MATRKLAREIKYNPPSLCSLGGFLRLQTECPSGVLRVQKGKMWLSGRLCVLLATHLLAIQRGKPLTLHRDNAQPKS